MLTLGQFMDGVAENESSNRYDYFNSGPDATIGTRDDLLGRFSMRRYNFEDWSMQMYGEVRDWHLPQVQDAVAQHQWERLFVSYTLLFPNETVIQLFQRLAAWWKLPTYANDVNPTRTWTAGLKSYVRHVGEKLTALGYEGWTTGVGWL